MKPSARTKPDTGVSSSPSAFIAWYVSWVSSMVSSSLSSLSWESSGLYTSTSLTCTTKTTEARCKLYSDRCKWTSIYGSSGLCGKK